MPQTYLSVPRVPRLEYLYALLQSYDGILFDETRARQAVQLAIQDFEQKKARALRRQRLRSSEGAGTLKECMDLALNLDLIDHQRRLKTKAYQVLDQGHRRSVLLQGIWQVYPRFQKIILTARDVGALDLPFYNWDEFRKQGGNTYGLDMDRKSFETFRDFATQLGLLNWFPTENSRQIVYPTACVATRSELLFMAGTQIEEQENAHNCRKNIGLFSGFLQIQEKQYQIGIPKSNGCIILQTENDQILIIDHEASLPDFEQTLWREYLKLSGMVAMSPVLYPSLRNQVCSILRISDQTFDYLLKTLVDHPQRLSIHPSDGTLSYAANLAHIGKFLPPQTNKENFIVYLKIERRGTS